MNGNVALLERRSVVELDIVVFADDLAIGDVFELVTANFDFHGDPLIAMKGGAAGLDDVGLGEFPFPMELGAGGADIEGAAVAFAKATEELDFNRSGEVLVFFHGFGVLAVKHEAIVPVGPTGTAIDLLADEAVGGTDFIMGVRGFVKEVAKLSAELLPFGIIDGEEPVFDLKGVLVIHTEIGAGEFGGPAGEILAVEKRDPGFLFMNLGLWFGFGGLSERDSESEHGGEEL